MPEQSTDNISDKCFAELLELIHKLTGITIGESRKSMMVSRLRKRLRANNLKDFESYLKLIQEDRDELQEFVDNMTTNKTYFHRTPRIWSYLNDIFIPQWIGERNKRPINVWSAAASTGAEAYTAGVFLEEFRAKTPGFDYKIFGTDVSSQVVATAEEGIYPIRAVQRFKQEVPDLFEKHMTGDDTKGYQVTPDIRRRIRFKHHNLFRALSPPQKFDIILIRNVLIYFTHEDQENALRNAERCMHPGATLIIGESETLSPLKTNFVATAPLVYRQGDAKAVKVA